MAATEYTNISRAVNSPYRMPCRGQQIAVAPILDGSSAYESCSTDITLSVLGFAQKPCRSEGISIEAQAGITLSPSTLQRVTVMDWFDGA